MSYKPKIIEACPITFRTLVLLVVNMLLMLLQAELVELLLLPIFLRRAVIAGESWRVVMFTYMVIKVTAHSELFSTVAANMLSQQQ